MKKEFGIVEDKNMRIVTLIFVVLIVGLSAVFAYGQNAGGGCDCVPDQVIVQLNNASDLGAVTTQ